MVLELPISLGFCFLDTGGRPIALSPCHGNRAVQNGMMAWAASRPLSTNTSVQPAAALYSPGSVIGTELSYSSCRTLASLSQWATRPGSQTLLYVRRSQGLSANKAMLPDKYQLPTSEGLIDEFQGFRVFPASETSQCL